MTFKNFRNLIPFAWLIIAILLIDQVTKLLVMDFLGVEGNSLKLLPIFNLTLVFNPGVSFGMLVSLGKWGPYILTALSVTMVVFLLAWLKNTVVCIERIALSIIIGGAIGNIIDRLRLGKVVDFIDFYINNHHWPAFNFADAMICIGVFLLLWSQLSTHRSEKNSA
ncbi:MAG: signal peptidase II [Alphaproteobacteria bacterium]|nr:signal peptidase II [Alphaproteobacteria bacterium]OJV45774.1 MAG: signal peptidase II [Alphaproteobacteria bacterium 43-37]